MADTIFSVSASFSAASTDACHKVWNTTNAQKYFDRDKIKQLIKYITQVPKENEYNIGYKYPYVASEMLKSAGERIQDMIVFTEEEFKKKYKI